MSILSKLDPSRLLEQLNHIGLHETDAIIYLASLRLGACTISQLTSQTRLNRITIHDSVGRLIEKGLLLETFSGRRRLVFPQQITHLQLLVDRKKAEVDQLQREVSTTIGLLQSLHLQSEFLPHIRISKGREGISDMIREIKEEKSGPVLAMSDSWHFDELLNVQFLDSLVQRSGTISMLLPAGFDHFIFSAKAKGILIDTRIIPDDLPRKGGITIRSNKVALHAYEGVYITTTIIENTPIVQMMTLCYESLWMRGK